MKNLCSLAVLGASLFSLVACTQGPKVTDIETFRTKTGVIGVFRQAATFCSEGRPQTIKLGDSTILVKPTWSDDQDNVFFSTMKPGPATLYSYEYQCWKDDFKLKLDQTDPSAPPVPTSVVIPDSGFCKIVISFAEGEKLFSHNDILIEEQFEKWNVAANPAEIPYCKVLDTKGGDVSFANKDSLIAENYKASIQKAVTAGSDHIQSVVSLESYADMVTWNSDRNRILMVVWHNDPEYFEEGRTLKIDEKNILWTVADKEFRKWFNQNKGSIRNWPLRLRQLLGFAPDTTLNYFSTIWVNPKDVIRPAFEVDPTNTTMRATFSDDAEGNATVYNPPSESSESAESESPFGKKDEGFMIWYHNWFDAMLEKRESPKTKRLWTRLGYTYDWSNDSPAYGLSEFVVVPDAEVMVNFTKPNKAFLNWLSE